MDREIIQRDWVNMQALASAMARGQQVASQPQPGPENNTFNPQMNPQMNMMAPPFMFPPQDGR